MSEPTATIPQFAEIPQFLGTSPARASAVLSILAHVGYNPEPTPAAFKAVSIVDESTAVERVAEYSALPVLPAWFDALKVHADFFPTGADKSPTCGSPRYSATTNTETLGNWSRQHRTAGFAARIRRGSRLMVIDLDQKNGRDGFTALGYVLLDHNITLPAGPVVQTPHGGRHLYMLRPARSPKIVSQVAIWDGVDIMAEKGQCILPGCKIRDGEYTLVEGSLDAIPDAPLALLQIIHERQKASKALNRKARRKAAPPLPYNDAPACLTPQERFRLFKNKVFRSFWNMGKEQGDTSLSAYEYHLAKACYCVGLDTNQTVVVIKWWWKHHHLATRSEKKLRKGIIPAAWREVAEYVVGWKSTHLGVAIVPMGVYTTSCITTEPLADAARNLGGRPLSARTLLVLALAGEHPEWSAGRIASAAVVSRKSAWIALRRHRPGQIPLPEVEAADESEFTPPESGNPVEMAELDAMEAEFQAYVAALEAESIEEEIPPPPPAPAPRVKFIDPTWPSWVGADEEFPPEMPVVKSAWPRFSLAKLKREAKLKKLIRKRELEQAEHLKWLLDRGIISDSPEPPSEYVSTGIFD